MQSSDARSRAGVLSKRLLVNASHVIESTALAGPVGDGACVIAMFQRLAYFERERAVYEQIARRASVTVVGMVDTVRPDLPPGVTPVLLRADETLAREWSVIVLTPEFGASLVAYDTEQVDPRETTLEAARLFDGRWGLRRDESYAETVRLRDALGDRLPPSARAQIDAVLGSVVSPVQMAVEQRAEAAVLRAVGQLDRKGAALARVRERSSDDWRDERDPLTGLHTLAAAADWLGTTAPGTLPLGLVLVRIDELDDLARVHDARIAMHVENNIADILRRGLRPVDRAVRVSAVEFLVVKPALSQEELAGYGNRIRAELASLHNRYPFIGITPAVCWQRCSSRPLPLGAMQDRLSRDWPPRTGQLVANDRTHN